MKKSRFSEEQIIGILREGKAGGTVKALCAKHNISEATYYGWQRKYGGLEVSEARKLRAYEEEIGRLKRLVADLSVQNQILKEVNAKKW
jgi:putative transposase